MAFILAAFFAVIIFLPPAGRIGAPLHDALASLLGGAAFMLPVALTFTGMLLVIRALRPSTSLPRRRLAGVALMLLATLPGEYLLGSGERSGLVGRWLSTWLLDLLGGSTTLLLLVAVLGVGILMTFDVSLVQLARSRLRARRADS